MEIDPVAEARMNLQSVLIEARGKLHPDDYEGYQAYFYASVAPLDLVGGSTFDNLVGTIFGTEIPLESELQWITLRFGHEKASLQDHVRQLFEIDAAVVRDDNPRALSLLDKAVEQSGHSIWSVQLKLALEQSVFGLEAQKAFYKSIRRRHKAGPLPYIAYQTSVRNEDRTTLHRFQEELRPKLAGIKPTDLGHYLRVKLLSEWPEDAQTIAQVLRIEQGKSSVDIYEAFVALSQESIRREELSWLHPMLVKRLLQIEIDDPRLDKLRVQLSGSPKTRLEGRGTQAGDALLAGHLTAAARYGRQMGREGDVWGLLYESAALSHRVRIARRPRPSIGHMLAQTLARSGESKLVTGELQKAAFNLCGVPGMRAVLDFTSQLSTGSSDLPFRFSLASLNSRQLGPEDISDQNPDLATNPSVTQRGASFSFWSGATDDAELQPDIRVFGNSVRLEREGDLAEAAATIRPIVAGSASLPLRSLSAALLLRCLTKLGAHQAAVMLVAAEAARPNFSLDLLPVAEALTAIPFDVYKGMGLSVEALIALDVLQRTTDNDRVRSQLRFATKRYLNSTKGKRPSLLWETDGPFDQGEFIYFLRNVCVPSVIDMSGILGSSLEVLEERQAICAVLNALDPDRTEDYQAEILGIVHQMTISEGLDIVNKNRIHVDTDMIARAFERSSGEEFARFLDLQRAGIGVAGDFDDVVRDIIQSARQGKQVLFTPQNEADNTFVILVARVLSDFLHHPSHGLDYFLSKRIRHQSFVGLVRGPLEFEQIITTRETATSDYNSNDFWLGRLATLGEDRLTKVAEAFSQFASSFDAAVFDLKDRQFHVRSAEHPDGIFDIRMSANAILLARAVVQTASTPAEFAKAVCEILWVQIDSKLKLARETISDDLKMRVAALVDRLRAEVSREAIGDPALADLQLAIGRASAAVQTALGEAEAWFNRPQVAQARRLFTLQDAVDIAIQSAKKLHRAFEPDIVVDVQGAFHLQAGDLVFLTDAVFIAFSNIRSYSGSKNPHVSVKCFVDEADETLHLAVENDVQGKMRSVEQDAILERIRAQIAQGTEGKHTKREGGTGFMKLAAVVSQSKKGNLEFGYVSDRTFRLAVTWSFILSAANGV